MEKSKQDLTALERMKEDMLSEIEFLKGRLEKERIDHQEKILVAQSENIALRTELKERETHLLSKIQDLQVKTDKVREEYADEKKTWEEMLKNREEEKNTLSAEFAVKESETVSEKETDRRKFFEREGHLLKEIQDLEKNIGFVKKSYEEKLVSAEKTKEELVNNYETKISSLQKDISAAHSEIKNLNEEIVKSQEDEGLSRGENIVRENELNQKIQEHREEIIRLKAAIESERAQASVGMQIKDGEVSALKKKYFETEKRLTEDLADRERRLSELQKQIERERDESSQRLKELEESQNVIRAEAVLRESSLRTEWSQNLSEKEKQIKELSSHIEELSATLSDERKVYEDKIREKENAIFELRSAVERGNADFRIALDAKNKEIEALTAQDENEIKFLKSRLSEEKETFEKRSLEEENRLQKSIDDKERIAQTLLIRERELEELKRELNAQRANFISKIEDLKVSSERSRLILDKREQEYKKELAARESDIANLLQKINEVNADWGRRLKFAEEEIFAKQKEKFNEIEEIKSAARKKESEITEEYNQRINELTEFKGAFSARAKELEKILAEKESGIEALKNILTEKESHLQNAAREKEIEIAQIRHKFEDEIFSARHQFESEMARFLSELGKKEEEKNAVSARAEKQIAVIDATLQAKETELSFAAAKIKETEAGLTAKIKMGDGEISALKLEISKLQEKLRLQLDNFSNETERQSRAYLEHLKSKDETSSSERLKLLEELESKEKKLQNIRIESEAKLKELKEELTSRDRNISNTRISYEAKISEITRRSEEEILRANKKISALDSEKTSLEAALSSRDDVLKNIKEVSAEKEKHLRELFETEKNDLEGKVASKDGEIRDLRTRIDEIDRRRKNELESKTLEFISERNRLREEISKYYNRFIETSQKIQEATVALDRANIEKESLVLEWRKQIEAKESEVLSFRNKIAELEKKLMEEENRGEKLKIKETELAEREKRFIVGEQKMREDLLKVERSFSAERANFEGRIEGLRKAFNEKENELGRLRSERNLLESKLEDMRSMQESTRTQLLASSAEIKKYNDEIAGLKNILKSRESIYEQEKRSIEAQAAARDNAVREDFKLKWRGLNAEKDSIANELANLRTFFEREKNAREEDKEKYESRIERKVSEFERKKEIWDEERTELMDKFYVTDATRKELMMEIEILERELKEAKKSIFRKIFG